MQRHLRLLALIAITALISGVGCAAFLYGMKWATHVRMTSPILIWGLPLFGLAMAMTITRIPKEIHLGIPYFLTNLTDTSKPISPWMLPFYLVASIGTHLFGGSAGREGVGVVIGTSASHFFKPKADDYESWRPIMISAGMAAGFSAIFNTPWAALIFALEVTGWRHVRSLKLVVAIALASAVAWATTHALKVPHLSLGHIKVEWQWTLVSYVAIAGLSAGLGANIFYWCMHHARHWLNRLLPRPELKFSLAGLAVACLTWGLSAHPYAGIGNDLLARIFANGGTFYDFGMKLLLTVLTLTAGFKGGEVTPLFILGASLSTSIAQCFHFQQHAMAAGLGMLAIFAATTATPIASTVMAWELFGPKAALLALVSCWVARRMMGDRTIYSH